MAANSRGHATCRATHSLSAARNARRICLLLFSMPTLVNVDGGYFGGLVLIEAS